MAITIVENLSNFSSGKICQFANGMEPLGRFTWHVERVELESRFRLTESIKRLTYKEEIVSRK